MRAAILAVLALSGVAGCGPSSTGPEGDFDGDTITDDDEGRSDDLDTDGDGTPDYRDIDADGDGLHDATEAGDADSLTLPRDADGDTTPDFQDRDADENGMPDTLEGAGDFDGDGIADFADLDDDQDHALDADELGGVFRPPADSDGDGQPNFRDLDSDDDAILDGDEIGVDTERDGLFDVEDLDSDGDGLSDLEEAGDDDVGTRPIDTDVDTIPDFRDADSDNDGLSDAQELALGSSPIAADTDDDGVSDLIELAAGTPFDDDEISPLTRGDFVFVVPFEEEPSPTRDTLELSTSITFADIYFLFDISGSMQTEIDELVDAVTEVMDDLTCADTGTPCSRDSDCGADEACSAFSGTCIDDPSTSACVASPWTGAGYYEAQLQNQLPLQASPAMTSSVMGTWSTFGATEALYRAVGSLLGGPEGSPSGCAPPAPGFVGCAAFREEAVKIVVAFTDEDSDAGTLDLAAEALRDAGVTFLGVWTGSTTPPAPPALDPRQALVDLAIASDSFAGDGTPLVFDGADASVVPAVTGAINEVVEGVPLRVTIEARDEPADAGNALLFVDYLEINTSGGACTAVSPTEDSDGDGRDDVFPALVPGTPVCWDIVPRANTSVEPTPEPQVFRARVRVLGDGSPLDARVVYFLVPPRIEPPGGPI